MPAAIKPAPFGTESSGRAAQLWTLTNAQGAQVSITDYGATVVSLVVPDAKGKLDDIVLGYDDVRGYEGGHAHFGALIGRYGNRIAHGRFSLDGKNYQLAINNGANHLHGGPKGFDRVLWQAKALPAKAAGEGEQLQLSYVSPDGDEQYPGRLSVEVVYTLTKDNTLRIAYTATTDAPTVLNLTNHSYFNLAGAHAPDVLAHPLTLNADTFTPTDASQIPTGEQRSVAGTPLDFRTEHAIGERIGQADEQLRIGHGYDHNFIIKGTAGQLNWAATVRDPSSGRAVAVWTTEPAVQLYTSNVLDGSEVGKQGQVYRQHAGFCLETQHFPDSPNHPAFPSTVLRPGQTYHQTTEYRFSAGS